MIFTQEGKGVCKHFLGLFISSEKCQNIKLILTRVLLQGAASAQPSQRTSNSMCDQEQVNTEHLNVYSFSVSPSPAFKGTFRKLQHSLLFYFQGKSTDQQPDSSGPVLQEKVRLCFNDVTKFTFIFKVSAKFSLCIICRNPFF